MPTREELMELRDNCTLERTDLNGVKGRRFISKKNGNSIFLPEQGERRYSGINGLRQWGFYWSSSLRTAFPSYGSSVSFNSNSVSTSDAHRSYGLSVRPVCE